MVTAQRARCIEDKKSSGTFNILRYGDTNSDHNAIDVAAEEDADYRQAGFKSDDGLFHAVVGYATSGNVVGVAIKEVVTTGIKRAAGQRDAGGILEERRRRRTRCACAGVEAGGIAKESCANKAGSGVGA